ncbi:hypothetical protein F5883DRAFT_357905, partial [Diaporthe sp. PMI_573]
VIRPDAIAFFTNSRGEALAAWVLLLQVTTFPHTIASSDNRFLVAFKALDCSIINSKESYMLRRFAYLRLIYLFNFLKSIIQSERRKGLVRRARGYGNASFALEIYLGAQGHSSAAQKRTLIERMRTGRRWKKLAGPSPFFLLIYSDAAEAVV